MTEIYDFDFGAGTSYRDMTLVNDDDWRPSRWEALWSLTPIRSDWVPPRVRFLDPGESGFSDDSKLSPSSTETDMPWIGTVLLLIVSKRFVDVLGSRFRPYGEFLPCECEQGTFYVFHCTNELDAIDFGKSDLDRDGDGRVTSIRRLAFRPEVVNNDIVFRCKHSGHWEIRCGKNVRDAMNQPPIKGATATLVWTEGGPPIKQGFDAFLDTLG